MYRRTSIALGGAALFAVLPGLVIAGGPPAAYPWGPVRNFSPQPASNPVRAEHPIHYALRPGGQPRSQADVLLREFFDLHTTMSYQRAAAVAEQLVVVAPHRADAHYNLACVMGRLHRADEALASLERAVDCGWRDLVHLSIDPDLDAVRATPRYQELTRRLKTLLTAERKTAPIQGDLEGAGPNRLRREVPPILARYGVPAATIAVADGGRITWIGSFDARGPVAGAPTEQPVEAGSCVRLIALGAMLRHDSSAGSQDRAERRFLLAGSTEGRGTPNVVDAVESVTREPFLPCCRRHVIEPLAMSDTSLSMVRTAAAGGPGFAVRSSAADLARLLAALTAPAPPGWAAHAAGLATWIGFTTTAERQAVLQLAHRSNGAPDAADVVLRWNPGTGRGVVVVTNGRDGCRAAGRIAGLALDGDRQGFGTSGPAGVN